MSFSLDYEVIIDERVSDACSDITALTWRAASRTSGATGRRAVNT